jgi:hypothetical protein
LIGVRAYSHKAEWVLDEVSFEYLEGRYRGRGVLQWEPDGGFHLDALVDRRGPPIGTVELGRLRIATRRDRTSVRLRMRHGGRAVAFATLTDRFDILTSDRLSCTLGALSFMTPLPKTPMTSWTGSLLVEVAHTPIWPDHLVRQTKLADATVGESFESSGLVIETSRTTIRGWLEDRHLTLHWSMPRGSFRRVDAWRFAKAFHEALCVELGGSLPLLERVALLSPRQHLERAKRFNAIDLHPFRPFEDDFVSKTRLMALTELFMQDTRQAQVARVLFSQMVRARQQAYRQDSELILSTALEGCLRAIDGVPSSDKNWKIANSIARFQDCYLSVGHRSARKKALRAFERLRHSTAHPDWLFDKTVEDGEAARQASLDDRRLLSRFYGSMILGLAGVPDLQPFPRATSPTELM